MQKKANVLDLNVKSLDQAIGKVSMVDAHHGINATGSHPYPPFLSSPNLKRSLGLIEGPIYDAPLVKTARSQEKGGVIGVSFLMMEKTYLLS